LIQEIDNSFFSRPYLESLFIKQNKWHKYGVLIHTFRVLSEVIKAKDYRFVAAAIFHDIGKPKVAHRDEEDMITGEYSFTDHEEKSYQIVKNWFFLSSWTKDVIRYHYLIRDRKNSRKKEKWERLKRLEKSWASLDSSFIKDLETFLIYDDKGKQ
jgi:predicted HD phosphohydrolase